MFQRFSAGHQNSAGPTRFPALMLVALLGALILALAAQPVRADPRRVALVVGNSDYGHLDPLPNATRDARDIAAVLQAQGFEVTLLLDGTQAAFRAQIAQFTQAAVGAEAALFYFSGHGFQKAGINYLAPVDARLDSIAAIAAQTLRLDDVTAQISAAARHSILLLDACRNTPLSPDLDVDLSDGLAVPETGRDTFMAFATQPGNLSYDGREGQNSPFTRALLRHLGTEGQSISEMMIEVRNEVQAATAGQQTPWDQSSLTVPFFFNPFTPTEADLALLEAMPDENRARMLRMWRAQGAQIAELDSAPAQPEVAERAEFGFDLIILDEEAPPVAPTAPDGAITLAALPEDTLPPGDIGVTRALQQLTSADIRATSRAAFVPDTPIAWLAALDPGQRGVDQPMARARIIGEDVTPPEMNLPDMTPRELARALQTELQRVGCYRMAIDGDWGQGSRRALAGYFTRTGQTPLGTEPTPEILVLTRAAEGEICPATRVSSGSSGGGGSSGGSSSSGGGGGGSSGGGTSTSGTDTTGSRLEGAIRNFR